MDYGGASKQEEGEHACYTLILLQEVKNLVSLCEILGRSAILNAASFLHGEILAVMTMIHPSLLKCCKLLLPGDFFGCHDASSSVLQAFVWR